MLADAIKTHWGEALPDARHPKARCASHIVLPIAAGTMSLVYRGDLSALGMLDGVAIVTGLLFSLATFMIQLRYQVRAKEAKITPTRKNTNNIDFGFYSSAYAIIIGIMLIAWIILGQAATSMLEIKPVTVAWSWTGISLFTHFLMTMGALLRRIIRVYQVFGLNQP